MSIHKKYLRTSLWYREKITDPYQTVAAFFDFGNVSMHRQDMHDMVKAACSSKPWKICSQDDLGERFERLESLVNAAWLINKRGQRKADRLEVRKDDISNPNLYFGLNDKLTVWEYFPRALSLEEFIDPYIVFGDFFCYKDLGDWKEAMNCLMQYTATKDNLHYGDGFFDTYGIHNNLLRLIEAAHLIDVREVNHIGGRIKYRMKKNNAFL